MEDACRRSPLLSAWADALARAQLSACQLLELDCGTAAAAQPPPPDAWWCTYAVWLGLAAVLAAAALFVAAGWRLVAHLSARDGTRMVAVAAEVLRELRKVQAGAYPSERHMFQPAPAGAPLCASPAADAAAAAASLSCIPLPGPQRFRGPCPCPPPY